MKIPLEVRDECLYCPEGDFYIDAWKPVKTCIITHAHSDHVYPGHGLYITTPFTSEILKHRLGDAFNSEILEYAEHLNIKNCSVSLYPAGHILGSAQVRIEINKICCVVSGDYKSVSVFS